jgi:flagellar hook-length control protein FliK
METIAATPLNLPTMTDVHGRRELTEGNGNDAGTFEQLLGNEIALISPDAATAAAAELIAATLAPATDESTESADGTQMLDAILDSASMLPPAAIPALIPDVKSVADPAEARAVHTHAATPATLQTSIAASAAEMHTDAAAAQLTETPVRGTADVSAPEARPATVQAAPVQPSAQAAIPTSAALLAASGSTPPAAETLGLNQKSGIPGAKPPTTASVAPGATETRENREIAAPQLREEPLIGRAEPNLERRQIETFVTGSPTEKLPAPDATAQPANTTSPLDALSSAALMPKWAPAAHATTDPMASAPATARVDAPVGSEGWGDAFRQKVVWLVDRQQQSAEIHVNPPHLGPVEVMLNLSDDGAHIVFCSPHASVREAIEASLAELRTALANNGLSLGQTFVSADAGTARDQLRDEMVRNPQAPASTPAESRSVSEIETTRPLRQGLVDIFA